jgi:predicted Rossmann fold flavoprotein
MKLAILGGGAAGMLAAATVNEFYPEIEIFLIEKNDSLGKKVVISGGGRCNVTTGITNIQTVLSKYPRGNKFLTTAMYNFSPSEVYTWFEDHGIPLKIEKDLRVFPQSNNGKDIVGVFEKIFAKSNTKVLIKHNVLKVEKKTENFIIHFKDQPSLHVEKLILTCGGQAYRSTGSTGDGYEFAEALGHTITNLAPSLNSFITLEKWPKILSGVSFEEGTVTAQRAKTYQFTGPFLFTHTGISGPAVFALSSLVAFEEYGPKNPLQITIDLVSSLSLSMLATEFKKQITEHPKKSFKNTIHTVVPKSVVEVACEELKIEGTKHNAEISKHELEMIAKWLKQTPLSVIGRGAGDEFVTAGGVNTAEVNPRTMESKITPGLFFAGEILDVDGFTGGFNLQAAWATGRTAGENIAT